jgi:N6-adenosine-specific RNA methylase IME4
MAVTEIQMPNPYSLQLPEGAEFGAIYADPPWPLDKPNTLQNRRRIHYNRMSGHEIKSVPVHLVAHPDAHLWMWTTNAHLKLALDVVEAWGFEYKTLATWRKSKIGTGWWLRSRTEHLILAARSNNKRHNPGNFTTEITGEWTGHSKKPESARRMIEALSPGPYLELFSRTQEKHPNWYSMGLPLGAQEPDDAFGQIVKRKALTPDPSDGRVRGVGGLEVVEGAEYAYVVKVLHSEPVRALEQKGRRVRIEIAGVKKWVSIDKLRAKGWTP